MPSPGILRRFEARRAITTHLPSRFCAWASHNPSSKPRRSPCRIFQAAAHAARRFTDSATTCQPGWAFSYDARPGPLRFTVPIGRASSTTASSPSPRQRSRNPSAAVASSNMTLITVFAIGRHFTEPHATEAGEGSMEKEIRSGTDDETKTSGRVRLGWVSREPAVCLSVGRT